jgi:hypothetical protein
VILWVFPIFQSGNEPVNASSKGNCKEDKTEENINSKKGAEENGIACNFFSARISPFSDLTGKNIGVIKRKIIMGLMH